MENLSAQEATVKEAGQLMHEAAARLAGCPLYHCDGGPFAGNPFAAFKLDAKLLEAQAEVKQLLESDAFRSIQNLLAERAAETAVPQPQPQHQPAVAVPMETRDKHKAVNLLDVAGDDGFLDELLAAGQAGADNAARKKAVAEFLAKHGAKRPEDRMSTPA